jgi:DNA-binding XRE family transcriptional regulator
MSRKSHEQLKNIALSRPGVSQAFESMDEEFTLLEELIKARLKAHKTQAQIAEQMGTSTSVIGRLETGGGEKKHSPTIATLQKYAQAVGCKLQLKLIPFAKLR